MKHTVSRSILLSFPLLLLAACSGRPVIPLPLPALTDEPGLVVPPAEYPAVMVDDSTIFAAMPVEKIVSFGAVVPSGFAVDTRNGVGFTFYSPEGISLGEIPAPLPVNPSPATIHFAGSYELALDFPVVFFSIDSQSSGLRTSRDGQVTPLVDVQTLSGLTGVPGQPLLAYGSMELQADGIMRTRIFLGDLASLADSSPVLVVDSSTNRAAQPLLIRSTDGQATGLWYTLRPLGGGGVFEPRQGLFFLDLAERAVYQALPKEAAFSAISQEQTWVVYSNASSSVSPLTLQNLATSQTVLLPPLPESDLGAGNAIFSTSSFIAWLEVRGSQMDGTSFSTIRVANEDGTFQQDFPQTAFYAAAGLGEQVSLRPLGWQDEQRFLVEVRSLTEDVLPAVVQVDIGSGGTITLLAHGDFVGFMHHP